jgi:hypothetical protein
VLLEWDAEIPPLEVVLADAARAHEFDARKAPSARGRGRARSSAPSPGAEVS